MEGCGRLEKNEEREKHGQKALRPAESGHGDRSVEKTLR
jgi:hypothetical protein